MKEVMKSIELSTHSIVDENQNEWTVIELSDLEWIMEDYHQAKLKLLNLHGVVQQRELLIAAAKGIYPHGDHKLLTKLIDKYLQGN